MFAFIVRRMIGAVALILIISAVTFSIFFYLPKAAGLSTDELAGRYAGKSPTPQTLKEIKERFNFDDPIVVQYGHWVKDLVAGGEFDTGTEKIDCPGLVDNFKLPPDPSGPCLGYSFRTDQAVWDEIKGRAPLSLSLIVGAAAMWLVAGVSIGVISALRRGSIFDRTAMVGALSGVSLPIFFSGLLMLAFIVHRWDLMPVVKYVPLTDSPGKWVQGLLLPWIALAFQFSAMYARLTRAGMLDTMSEDYIRTARAKGLKERTVIMKHGLRPALTPIVTMFGLDLALLVGGTILTERAFSLHGLGDLALRGVNGNDLPVVLGVVFLSTVAIVIANMIVDIMYGVIDPRVRTS